MTRERTETGDNSKNRATAGEKENLPGSTVYFTLLCFAVCTGSVLLQPMGGWNSTGEMRSSRWKERRQGKECRLKLEPWSEERAFHFFFLYICTPKKASSERGRHQALSITSAPATIKNPLSSLLSPFPVTILVVQSSSLAHSTPALYRLLISPLFVFLCFLVS